MIRGKSHRQDRMPLPCDVGKALANYLCNVRPCSSSRRVFMRNLENIPEQLPLVVNLKNPNYIKLIFSAVKKLGRQKRIEKLKRARGAKQYRSAA